MAKKWVFDGPAAITINQARQSHLGSLGLPLSNKKVLEVGAGIGKHTYFFIRRHCDVLSTEGRPENVAELQRRYPKRKAVVADLAVPGSHVTFGKFDIVYAYGILYHLKDPELAICELAYHCDGLFLVDSVVWPEDDQEIHRRQQGDSPDQAMHGWGCTPGRPWYMETLKKYYEYVYVTVTQANHPHWPLEWPAWHLSVPRAVFVASRTKLDLPTLSTELLERQARYEG